MTTPSNWFHERESRTRHYPGAKVLDGNCSVAVVADVEYAQTYEGQVAITTSINLLSRMCRGLRFDIPEVPALLPGVPLGASLRDVVESEMSKASPHGIFRREVPQEGDAVFFLGRTGAERVIHSSGWMAYLGPAPSPLYESNSQNPFGAAFAAIVAVAEFCANGFRRGSDAALFDTLTWKRTTEAVILSPLPHQLDLGTLWTIGVGSVGSAVLYFLTLATRNFASGLFDMDSVGIHNLDRSPVFADADVNTPKVTAISSFLRRSGVKDVFSEACAFHEAKAFKDRKHGTPDLYISAANEFNVREITEATYPPLQIYATTGRKQASLIRHIPLKDACSSCLFPPQVHKPMGCAEGEIILPGTEEKMDASLPFLSFAAGLMAAAEIVKLQMPGFPFSENQVLFNSRTQTFVSASRRPVAGCAVCSSRSARIHMEMLGKSRYATLSR